MQEPLLPLLLYLCPSFLPNHLHSSQYPKSLYLSSSQHKAVAFWDVRNKSRKNCTADSRRLYRCVTRAQDYHKKLLGVGSAPPPFPQHIRQLRQPRRLLGWPCCGTRLLPLLASLLPMAIAFPAHPPTQVSHSHIYKPISKPTYILFCTFPPFHTSLPSILFGGESQVVVVARIRTSCIMHLLYTHAAQTYTPLQTATPTMTFSSTKCKLPSPLPLPPPPTNAVSFPDKAGRQHKAVDCQQFP
jgi:hypothetical protein